MTSPQAQQQAEPSISGRPAVRLRLLAVLASLGLALTACQAAPPARVAARVAPAPARRVASRSEVASTPLAAARPASSSTAPNCRKLKCIALTFDDGPGSGTNQLVKILADEGVHATFFLVGQKVLADRHTVERMARDGHVIGNHSWTHPELSKLSTRQITAQLRRTSAVITRVTGQKVTLARPPFGDTSPRVRAVERKLGLAQILWNVDTLDWKTRSKKATISAVLGHARRGQIVLMHSIWPSTRAAAPAIIHGLRKRGFTLVTIPELLGKTSPGVNYSQR